MNNLKRYFQLRSWTGEMTDTEMASAQDSLVRMKLCPGQEIYRYRPIGLPSPDPYNSLFFINPHTMSGSTSRLLSKHQCTICKLVFHKHFGLDFHKSYDHSEEEVRVRKMKSLQKSVIMKWYLIEGDFIWQRRLWWHCLHWNLDISSELRFGWRGSLWQVVPKYFPCSHLRRHQPHQSHQLVRSIAQQHFHWPLVIARNSRYGRVLYSAKTENRMKVL